MPIVNLTLLIMQMDTSKMTPLPYTIGLIKPDTVAKPDALSSIFSTIESSGLTIYSRQSLTLDKEDVMNLFSKHKSKPFFQATLEYLTGRPSEVLLLTMIQGNPISTWKQLIGPSDPAEAKSKSPESLRAVYGTTLLKNEFYGSDDNMQANRERDIFYFPVPVREPDFSFDKYKITQDTLLKFLFPQHLEHSNVIGRLDLFAIYGPVTNYHSVSLGCFCLNCSRIGKQRLKDTTGLQTVFKKGKLSEGNKRVLEEPDILEIWGDLCENCKNHCENYSHLPSGRGNQHLLTDLEISQLIKEHNLQEISLLLSSAKGNSAKAILHTLDLTEPKELNYSATHVRTLLQEIETDYFNRMQFYDMQHVILEDMRIRMNY